MRKAFYYTKEKAKEAEEACNTEAFEALDNLAYEIELEIRHIEEEIQKAYE